MREKEKREEGGGGGSVGRWCGQGHRGGPGGGGAEPARGTAQGGLRTGKYVT